MASVYLLSSGEVSRLFFGAVNRRPAPHPQLGNPSFPASYPVLRTSPCLHPLDNRAGTNRAKSRAFRRGAFRGKERCNILHLFGGFLLVLYPTAAFNPSSPGFGITPRAPNNADRHGHRIPKQAESMAVSTRCAEFFAHASRRCNPGPVAGPCVLRSEERAELRRRTLALHAQALNDDHPVRMQGTRVPPTHHAVLDASCLEALGRHPRAKTFADFVDRPEEVQWLLQHPLVDDLCKTLEDVGWPSVVLSLSGGVDSMAHLALLWAAVQLRGSSDFRVAALHISPGSIDTRRKEEEEEWLAYICSKLHIPFYVYHSRMKKPRSGAPIGISRREYESATMLVRFRMYERVAEKFSANDHKWVAVLAHHLDDVNENRLVSLSRGKRFALDGMQTIGVLRGVRTLRPFLHMRKEALVEMATKLPMCILRDDQPGLRQWVRHVFQCERHRGQCHEQDLLTHLDHVGRFSDKAEALVQKYIDDWIAANLQAARLLLHPAADMQADGSELADVWACGVDMGSFLSSDLVQNITENFKNLQRAIADVRAIWNPAIAAAEQMHLDAQHGSSDGVMGPTVGCPLKPIPPPHEDDIGFLIFEKAMRRVAAHPSTMHVLEEEEMLSPKALRSLWSDIQRVQHSDQLRAVATGYVNHNVHYVYHADLQSLTLFATGERSRHLDVDPLDISLSHYRHWKRRVAEELSNGQASPQNVARAKGRKWPTILIEEMGVTS